MDQVERGITVLRQGGLVAFPTDTVYGLGASAYNTEAVKRIYEVKGRPITMALPLLLADIGQMSEVAQTIPPIARLLADAFLPGALTIVLLKSPSVPEIISGGGSTVAVRIPAHPVPVALARETGPIVGTSANISGKPSAVTAAQVSAQLGDTVDLIIDGGTCPGGRESTVIDVTGERPIILREGAISKEALQKVCDID